MGRAFGFLGIVIVLGVGWYVYMKQYQAVSTVGGETDPAGAALVTGVQNDLISIANAERGFMASEGKYASLDELVSGHYLTIQKERPPYAYDLQITSNGFQATARRTTPGSPAQIWIDQTMQVQRSN